MNVIDHRILIPTSPENVWSFISNIQNLPEWQVNVTHVSLLTSPNQVPGPGMRWRTEMTNNREHVVMVTAWYDRLGYEYTIVDGVSFKSNKGQIRLQEIAEGTIVQWTFQFETTGLFGGLRNGMGSKRSIEQDMIDSLRMLWKVIDRKRVTKDNFEARSLMRDAPDATARANYKARHPSVFEARAESDDELLDNVEDDTRPRGVELEETPETGNVNERFAPPSAYRVEDDYSRSTQEVREFAESDDENDEIIDETLADAPDAVETDLAAPELPQAFDVFTEAPTSQSFTASNISPSTDKGAANYETGDVDTSKISVFELFGLQKPSETQEIRAVRIEEDEISPLEEVSSDDLPLRYGLRAKLRREDYKLRRPY